MRVFKALIISLLVYALFIWLYLTYFSKIQTSPTKLNNHVIKIDIRDIPVPVKPTAPKVKAKPKQKVLPKKVIKKKKIIVKKTPSKKKVYVAKKKSKALEKFEDEMVYIDEPMLKPQNIQPQPVSPWSYPNSEIRSLYGSEFHSLTETQKKFIITKLHIIKAITQATLNRIGPYDALRMGQEGNNVVSFKLHPNGDISDLKLKTHTGYRVLDETSLKLIRVAHMDYPYPETTTLMVYRIFYYR